MSAASDASDWALTPAGRLRAALGIAGPPALTAEARMEGYNRARELAAQRWAVYGAPMPSDQELRSMAEALAPRPEMPSEPRVDVADLVRACGYGVLAETAPCGQRHTASRRGEDGVWRFIPCGCADQAGTAAWDARRARNEHEMSRKFAVAPATGDDDW